MGPPSRANPFGFTFALGCALAAALCGAPAVRAQNARDVDVSMSADRTRVRVGEGIQVEIRVEMRDGASGSVALPEFPGFRVVGKSVQRSSTFGGTTVMTTMVTLSLVAEAPGRHTVLPARVDLGGRSVQSGGLVLTVEDNPSQGSGALPPATLVPLDPQGNPAQQPVDPNAAPPSMSSPAPGLDGARFDPQGFLRTVVDKAQARVGEQITVTIYLYVRGGLSESPTIHREPSTDGFWMQTLQAPGATIQGTSQVIEGVRFRAYPLKRVALFPMRAGTLTIGAMDLSFQLGTFFDFFGSSGNTGLVRREGVPVQIEVSDLPAAGRPSGPIAVGRFTLEAQVDRAQVATGDAVTLTATIRGSGNIRDVRLETPRVDGLRFLDPEINDDVQTPGDVVSGTRTIRWLFVPERAGNYTLDSLRLATFDPATGTYGVAAAQPITLTAAGNSIAQPPAAEAPVATEREELDLAQRLPPVRTTSLLRRRGPSLADQPAYPWLLGAMPAAYAFVTLAQLLRRRGRSKGADDSPSRSNRRARARLAEARALGKKGDARAFYTEIAAALNAMIEARLGEPIGGYTLAELRAHLAARGMPIDLVERVVEELEGADFARFSASGAANEEISHCLERAQALMERIERVELRASAEKEATS